MLAEYGAYLEENGKSHHTIKAYTNDIQAFFFDTRIKFGGYVVAGDIRRWIKEMLTPKEGRALAVSTINRRLNSLRGFFVWALEKGYVQADPMRDIHDIRVADEEQEKIMWLTEEEFEELLERMRTMPIKSRGVDPEEKYRRDRAIVYILTYTGIRVEELSNLKINDLDMQFRKIRVVGKGRKVRTIPIATLLYHDLMDWLDFRSEVAKKKHHVAESLYVFYSQRSNQLSVRGIQTMLEAYSTPQKKLTPHMFRHTFCKWMIKSTNNDIEKVRRLAGHSHISTTARYIKDSYTDLANAVESLPRI
ncbi:tyrosine-type recombinase/integrase [Aneurinibacillus danicus]|uniref:tyrosine-type recombinase/integrase n=1 Tax=Aneurinibacillus danicus TaxID=267746 RepID=UPI0011BE3958|nr:tyrosine-type recombinase/integrase [Aneurinibacillus danicus]